MRAVIGETLIHEVGHYFGLSEEEIEEIEERYWRGETLDEDEDDAECRPTDRAQAIRPALPRSRHGSPSSSTPLARDAATRRFSRSVPAAAR